MPIIQNTVMISGSGELALSITDGSVTCFDKVNALESYLLNEYYYSLKPGVAADGNQLHHFLFESKKGYCSYFAFAMALLARSVGVPARVTVGFFVDPGSEIFHYYPVRADMAHAWVEVFFPDYGWIEFDPTSTVIAPGEEYQFESFDMQEVSSLIEEILNNRNRLREEEEAAETDENTQFQWIHQTLKNFKVLFTFWYLTIPGLYVCLCIIIRCFFRFRSVCSKQGRTRVKRIYNMVIFLFHSLGAGRRKSESIREYAERNRSAFSYCAPAFYRDVPDGAFFGNLR